MERTASRRSVVSRCANCDALHVKATADASRRKGALKTTYGAALAAGHALKLTEVNSLSLLDGSNAKVLVLDLHGESD